MLYSIGDIHGNISALRNLYSLILEDINLHGKASKIIFLGDYIDRGTDSREVLDFLMGLRDSNNIEHVFLLGNHEQMLIDSLELEAEYQRLSTFDMWLNNGGYETLVSFNILPVYQQFVDKFPQNVLNWIKNKCVDHFIHENVIFAHAQYSKSQDYSKPISEHTKMLQIWGRSFDYDAQSPYFLVCGHTPKGQLPHYNDHYVCIDTLCGKLKNAPLTAFVLPNGSRNPDKPYKFIRAFSHE